MAVTDVGCGCPSVEFFINPMKSYYFQECLAGVYPPDRVPINRVQRKRRFSIPLFLSLMGHIW